MASMKVSAPDGIKVSDVDDGAVTAAGITRSCCTGV